MIKRKSLSLILIICFISILSAFDWKLLDKETEEIGQSPESFKRIKLKNKPAFIKLNLSNTNVHIQGINTEPYYFEINYNESEDNDALFSLVDGEFIVESRAGKTVRVKELKIFLPNETNLNIFTENGDIDIDNFYECILNLNSNNGSVKLENLSNNAIINVKTSNGNISLNHFDQVSEVSLESSGGSIELLDIDSEKPVTLKTISGDIFISNSKFDSFKAKTISGGTILENSFFNVLQINTINSDVIQRNSNIQEKKFSSSSGKWYIQE